MLIYTISVELGFFASVVSALGSIWISLILQKTENTVANNLEMPADYFGANYCSSVESI